MADAPEEQNLVDFEPLTRSTTEPETTPPEFGLNVGLGDRQAGRKSLDDDNQSLTMGFAGGQVSQHDLQAIRAATFIRVAFRAVGPIRDRLRVS